MVKRLITILICLLILANLASSALAVEAPYYTYTFHPRWGYARQSPHAYLPELVYDGRFDEAVGGFVSPSDVVVGPDERMYIADTGNNRVVVLRSDFSFEAEIRGFFNTETERDDAFSAPEGLFVSPEGNIYVADTQNNRVVLFWPDYTFRQVVRAPVSKVLPANFSYRPCAVAVDKAERLYVVSKTTGMGIVEMNLDSEFQGFLGAQRVRIGALDWFRRLFMTEEQRRRQQRFVPMEYNNITIDERGFLYVTTGTMASHIIYSAIDSRLNDTNFSPVKKLNPAGRDIMARNGSQPIVGDVDMARGDQRNAVYGPSVIADVALAHSGIFSILDIKRNKIFTYTNQGELLFAFGGMGIQEGNTLSPTAISYKGDDFLILDRANGTLNLYRQTDYGATVFEAVRLYESREYTRSIEKWQEILTLNSNFDLAYIGYGRAQMLEDDFRGAMENFRMAGDVTQYSNALREYRKVFVEDHLLWILLLVAIIVTLVALLLRKCKKTNAIIEVPGAKGKKLLKDLSYAQHVIFHPFDGFWDVKHAQRGSSGGALVILGASILITAFSYIGSGYIRYPSNYSLGALVGAATTICAPLLIWCLANWCLTTLMDGEGTMKDIFVTTCYSLTPYVLMLLFTTVISNFLVIEEFFVVTFLNGVALIWSFLLIFFGMITIHNYSLPKNILVTACSLLGMVIITFLGTLFIDLTVNMVSYFTSIYKELSFRL